MGKDVKILHLCEYKFESAPFKSRKLVIIKGQQKVKTTFPEWQKARGKLIQSVLWFCKLNLHRRVLKSSDFR